MPELGLARIASTFHTPATLMRPDGDTLQCHDEESLPIFRQVFREHPIWVEITKRNVISGDLPNDPPRIQRVLDQAVAGKSK